MNTQTILTVCVLTAALGGCSRAENPRSRASLANSSAPLWTASTRPTQD